MKSFKNVLFTIFMIGTLSATIFLIRELRDDREVVKCRVTGIVSDGSAVICKNKELELELILEKEYLDFDPEYSDLITIPLD